MLENKPAYLQLKEYILQSIQNESYKAGMRLPSERQFCEIWGISRMTVRRALDELVQSGLLMRAQGSGTYVSKKKVQHSGIMSFTDMVHKWGMEPSAKILEQKLIKDAFVAERLLLDENAELFMIKRLRLANDSPIGIEVIYIPLQYCPEIDQKSIIGSLYQLLEQEYDYKIKQIDINISVSKANKAEQELLLLDKTAPVMNVEGISITTGDLPLLYQKSIYSGDTYSFNASITSRWS